MQTKYNTKNKQPSKRNGGGINFPIKGKQQILPAPKSAPPTSQPVQMKAANLNQQFQYGGQNMQAFQAQPGQVHRFYNQAVMGQGPVMTKNGQQVPLQYVPIQMQQYSTYPYPPNYRQSVQGSARTPISVPVQAKKTLKIVDPRTQKEVSIDNKEPLKVVKKETVVPNAPAPKSAIALQFLEQVKAKLEADKAKENKKKPEVESKKSMAEQVKENLTKDTNHKSLKKPKQVTQTSDISKLAETVEKITINVQVVNGKKVYSLKDLRLLKRSCNEMPEAMKNLDLNKIPTSQAVMKPRGSAFSNKGKGGRGQPPKWTQSKTQGNKNTVMPSIPVDVQLHKAENAWKPQARTELGPHEKLVADLQSLLNKLSREKYDKIANKVSDLEIPSLISFKIYVTLIREKALKEPNFADMYAELCALIQKKMNTKATNKNSYTAFKFCKFTEDGDKGFTWATNNNILTDEIKAEAVEILHEAKSTDDQIFSDVLGPFATKETCVKDANKNLQFKRYLLTLCQQEFVEEGKFKEIRDLQVKLKNNIETYKKEKKEEKQFETQSELKAANAKESFIKRRMMGNMIFIGELFVQDLISIGILSFCINKLTNVNEGTVGPTPSHEDVECLCKLLSTVGKKFEKKNVSFSEKVFERVSKLSEAPELDTRHKFMCKDLLDLRASKWKSKKKKAQTKKEVHAEARKEEETRQRELREAQASNRSFGRNNRSNPMSSSSFGGSGRNSSYNSAPATKSITNLGNRPRTGVSVLKKSSNELSAGNIEKIKKKAKSGISEFSSIKDEKEVVEYLRESLKLVPHLKPQLKELASEAFLFEVLLFYIDGKPAVREVIPRAIQLFFQKKLVTSKSILVSCIQLSSKLSDIEIDAPNAGKLFGEVLAEVVKNKCLEIHQIKDLKQKLSSTKSLHEKVINSFFDKLKDLGVEHKESKVGYL